MKTIYKYYLKLAGSTVIELPIGSRILSVGNQRGDICIWAEVDTVSPYTGKEPITEDIKFYVIGTGESVPDNLKYLGTVIIEPFVWHVYQENVR